MGTHGGTYSQSDSNSYGASRSDWGRSLIMIIYPFDCETEETGENMITENTFKLLRDIMNTNSPSRKLDILKNYLLKEGRDNSQTEIDNIIDHYQTSVNEKVQQGLQHAKKRKYSQTKKGKKTFKKPKFFPDFKGGSKCDSCQMMLSGGAAFRHLIDGKYLNYHCMPECFPASHAGLMMHDKDYVQWKEPK